MASVPAGATLIAVRIVIVFISESLYPPKSAATSSLSTTVKIEDSCLPKVGLAARVGIGTARWEPEFLL